MKRQRLPPDDPHEWLNRARSNLAHGAAFNPDVYLEDHCFDLQQCAEKAIKAVFVARKERFPFVHDLEQLLGMLEKKGIKVPKYVWESIVLTPFAGVSRYPAEQDAVTLRQYRRLLRNATAVLRWAERQIK